jgi:hypothetical protein
MREIVDTWAVVFGVIAMGVSAVGMLLEWFERKR